MMTPTIDRAAWADAYRLHDQSLQKLGKLDQDSFWNWYHDNAQQIALTHGNGALIVALLLAVFDDVEARDIEIHRPSYRLRKGA